MKIHGRTFIALPVVLAVLALSGGDAPFAQPKKTVVTVKFYDDGTVESVLAGNTPLAKMPIEGKYNIVKGSVHIIGITFLKTENSPATCEMWIGNVRYQWPC